MQQPIAILDSGVGGLTVVKEVLRQLPREKVIYFGDTARAPYGPRTPEEVRQFTREVVDYLVQYDPKMIVIACNTATAVSLLDIRARVDIPVVGVINPGARAAIGRTKTGCVGVIGTEGTIKSRAYEDALRLLSPHVQVVSEACPQFVPLVEKGNFRSVETYEVVRSAIEHMRSYPIDCLILGCTHYPYLSETISEVMGEEVNLINSAEETAREVSAILQDQQKLAKSEHIPVHHFFCSGDPKMFKFIAQQWLGEQIELTPVIWQVPNIS
ncbi:glutamate racemase [Paenibacillus yanchengensis]|uniref:Glutamate racemase n=1 Tax=Paenibacillus yanchengensis TaxID=2035833 RepID=A0ABW4YNV5_9BACL